MNDASLKEWVALNMVPGMTAARFNRLIRAFGTPGAAMEASERELAAVERMTAPQASAFIKNRRNMEVDREIRLAEKLKARIITIVDDSYPEILKTIYDPPPVLYIRGEFREDDQVAIAIVGSRHATTYGKLMSEELSSALSRAGFTIISGLARGIDTAAHQAAIKNSGRTIAVLGNGLAVAYPPENRGLMEKIAETGALVSEFPMTTSPDRYNFPRRNRIIAGLSLGTVVVEAADQSGALITAEFALEQGREVFAVPGNASSKSSNGTNQLIKDGAKLVQSAEDILDEFPEIASALSRQKTILPFKPRSADAMAVYKNLSREPIHIDDISRKSGISADRINAILMELELSGLAKQISGKLFVQTI